MIPGAVNSAAISRLAQRPLVIVPMRAKGGGLDDWPSVIGQANALAYKGAVALLPQGGDFLCKSVVPLVSGVTILGRAGVRVVSSLTPTGGPAGFSQSPFFSQLAPAGLATTLTAQPAIGAYVVSITNNFVAIGDVLSIGDSAANVAQTFKVLNKTGAGPYLLTLDDAVQFAFPPGSTSVQSIVAPSDILIDGGGMIVTGTGDRAFEIASAERCVVRRIQVTRAIGVFEAMGGSFDVGGRDNLIEDVWVDGGQGAAVTPTNIGLALESQVRSTIRDCRVRYVGTSGSNAGYYLATCAKCVIEDSHAWHCFAGALLAPSSTSDFDATARCSVLRSDFLDSASFGMLIEGGRDVSLVDVRANGNASAGVIVTNGETPAGTTVDLSLSNVWCCDNGTDGLAVTGIGGRIVVQNLTTDRNGGYGVNFASDAGTNASLFVDGWLGADCVLGPWVISNGNLFMRDAYFRISLNGFWDAQVTGIGTADLSGVVYELLGSPSGTKALVDLQAAGATLRMNDVRTIGAFTYGVFAAHATASKTYRGEQVDLSSCATPYNLDASALANFGTFTANGATGVAVAGCFLADEPIVISMLTPAGTQGAQPFITAKAANSFTVKATALDVGLYSWKAV